MEMQHRARGARIESWLSKGGIVLAANERAARSAIAAYHATRLADGQSAWVTPAIFAWENWLREQWSERNIAGLVLLNALQEQALWSKIIGKTNPGIGLLNPGRLASAAQQAFRLVCDYAPQALRSSARSAWSGDAAIFGQWMEAFESQCRRDDLTTKSRLTLELADLLQQQSGSPRFSETQRPPLLLIGFDRLLETQRSLLNAWGAWQPDERKPKLNEREPATQSPQFLAEPNAAAELEACAHWLRSTLKADPQARLLVVTPGLQGRRGDLERILLSAWGNEDVNLDFEFSLGVPIGKVGLVRSAILLLRWLHEPISEPELDWLLSCRHCVHNQDEEIALAETMRELRQSGRERPEWQIEDFAHAEDRDDTSSGNRIALHRAWASRLLAARDKLRELPARQSPSEWAELATQLLDGVAWPGYRPLSSIVFQARERWQRVLEDGASLGFDGTQMEWPEFVSTIAEAVSTTIFAAESSDARVLITEPLESAGQLADGIWFLGANEENWPGRGQPHPLLPIALQRDSGMPHASPQADWDLAQEATLRLLASSSEVIFSYAKHAAETEARPSRLVIRHVGAPAEFPETHGVLSQSSRNASLVGIFEDASLIPFPHGQIGGGAAILTRQSQCPFQAFATSRLNAEDWAPAEAGLNAKQRGQLLHSVLHRIWAGPAQRGISDLAGLQSIPDLPSFVRGHVRAVMTESFDPRRRNSLPRRFPPRYLELEAERLTRLVTEWLEYERERQPFVVEATEVKRPATVAGLTLNLRLDRIDRLPDGGRLIVDYKSSEVGPKAWAGDRPDDVQLPLYAAFAMPEAVEGLVFARIRPGQAKFAGRVRDAVGSLLPSLGKQSSLVKDPLTDIQLAEWHDRIERLGQGFLAGRAEVDPKDPVKTCERCHLHAVCRIYENQPLAAISDEADESNEISGEEEDNPGGIDA